MRRLSVLVNFRNQYSLSSMLQFLQNLSSVLNLVMLSTVATMKSWIFYLLLLLLSRMVEAIGTTNPVLKAIGGRRSQNGRSSHDDSFMFSLERNEHGIWSHRCSAFVLNENYLLTAAHCLFDEKCVNIQDEFCGQYMANELRVVSFSRSTPFKSIQGTFEVQSYKIHPNFYTTKSAGGDISIIKVHRNHYIDFDKLQITPVRLGTSSDRFLSKGNATLIYWSASESQMTPNMAEASIVSHAECEVQYNTFNSTNYYEKEMGCMRSLNGFPKCEGGSANGVYYDHRLIGMWVIFKNGQCVRRKTHVYVSVPAYRSWISRNSK